MLLLLLTPYNERSNLRTDFFFFFNGEVRAWGMDARTLSTSSPGQQHQQLDAAHWTAVRQTAEGINPILGSAIDLDVVNQSKVQQRCCDADLLTLRDID